MTTKKVPCAVFSRICGYFAQISMWNVGKRQEFADRKVYNVKKGLVK